MSEGLGQVVSWYICTVVATIFLILRLWIRIRKLGSLAVDDGFIILATACLWGDLIIQQYMWNLGMASIPTATPENFKRLMQMIVPGSILYVTSLWAIKIALVLFYKRLAAPGTKLQLIYNITLGLLITFWAAIFFDIIFQCFPHDKRWSQDPAYQCDPKQAEINYWLTIVLNIGTDVFTICLPIYMVLQLQMKLKQKIGVAAIFALGFLVVVASIIRAYYSKRNETMLTCTVSMIETAVAIIATCLPPLRTLFLGQMSSARTGSNYQRYELSSTGQDRSRRTHHSRVVTNVLGGTQNNDSQDELFKESAQSLGGRSAVSDKSPGITVNTTIMQQHSAENQARISQARLDDFA
ncbi:integral membrane protein PTH11 [Fusarium heterosporum]|uniref:Integral membrane protein PTH11 n=1 Tax=Fusarium heterosporum TaxID=42747 RepID=A0A8H5SRJ6_FUSHE|nr:integral membrane protein PTH11 [Fusarium heterosporum]